MSPRSPARMRRNLDTEVQSVCCRRSLPAEPLPNRVALGCNRLCELRRCCRAPGLLQEKADAEGPKAPAQLSQYAASPIRYGHPPETVACPLG